MNRDDVVAVVLTFRRERLATEVVRGLIDTEGFPPSRIVVIVNGEGGLADRELESSVELRRLPSNIGPAGGFRAGLLAARELGARWIYLCEDDIGLFDLPSPRVERVLDLLDTREDASTIGAVAAYARTMNPRTGRTVPFLGRADEDAFVEVDVAAWGASLVRLEVVDDGVLPDTNWFFGYEDFDFWLAMRDAGYRLVVDTETSRVVADRVFFAQRDASLEGARPIDAEEPWRRYYEARNFMALRRKHGQWTWTASHLMMTFRRMQLSPTWAHRRAALRGLWDGLRGKLGRNERYLRRTGERSTPSDWDPNWRVLQVITDTDRRGAQVFATDLHNTLVERGVKVRTVALTAGEGSSLLEHEPLGPRRRHLVSLLRLRRLMDSADVAIAHGSTTLPMCALASLTTSTPFIYRQISQHAFWVTSRGRRLRTTWALHRAAHVTALWEGAARTLTEDFGVHPEKITIIPNGVPAERCPPITPKSRLEARQRFGLDSERPVLLSIGALAPEKGVETLVAAMAHEELRGWQLLIVGRGPEESTLRTKAEALPAGAVTFHPPVASAADAIAAADVVGLTSRGGDSMPAVLIEAGMMGIPAVATPIEGIVDIVLDGRTGRLVPVDSAASVASAVAEIAAATAHGQRAIEHCLSAFEIKPVASRWLEALAAIVVSGTNERVFVGGAPNGRPISRRAGDSHPTG